MAIKKRSKSAVIEAFGEAAERPVGSGQDSRDSEGVVVAPARSSRSASTGRREAAGEWPEGVARTMLIRWPDPELAAELDAVAKMDDRSQHATAIRALRRGLEAIKGEIRA
ncbi:hypothetical protein [Citricoccus sp. I39-566]|uniref:hypothetical protein n=1 Tax=Citricoccus sp. I39-566 TaxID=3073268 RepID=UPI00286BE733|nr:hypothetical protein [Citricoccus sp. I39-566]WMY80066.1 hypothetical protein RE421_16760 [Citricoccus sp. I39-566]